MQTFQWLLNPRQVFDLCDGGPEFGLAYDMHILRTCDVNGFLVHASRPSTLTKL